MLVRLVLTIAMSGVVTFSASATDWTGIRKNSRPRSLRSFFSSLIRKKLEIAGRLSTENAQPMSRVLVYADASRCSLALPLDATGGREGCRDKRVIGRTDDEGYYRLFIQVGRKHKYLHVRFKIEQQGEQPTIIPLASVDQMLGRMKVGSYYRIDSEYQRRLVTEARNLVYTSRIVPLDTAQFNIYKTGDQHHITKLMLGRTFRQVLDQREQDTAAAGCEDENNWRWGDFRKNHPETKLVDFRFLFPKSIPQNKFLARISRLGCGLAANSVIL